MPEMRSKINTREIDQGDHVEYINEPTEEVESADQNELDISGAEDNLSENPEKKSESENSPEGKDKFDAREDEPLSLDDGESRVTSIREQGKPENDFIDIADGTPLDLDFTGNDVEKRDGVDGDIIQPIEAERKPAGFTEVTVSDDFRDDLEDYKLPEGKDANDGKIRVDYDDNELGEGKDWGEDGYPDDRIQGMFDYVEGTYWDDHNSPEWQEVAYRLKDELKGRIQGYRDEIDSLQGNPENEAKIEELQGKIKHLEERIDSLFIDLKPDYQSEFVGYGGDKDFGKAYQSFITDRQGNKVYGIQGPCGLNAMQNIDNLLNGNKLGERPAINRARGLGILDESHKDFRKNGGTNYLDRKKYADACGLKSERYDSSVFHRIDLDKMMDNFTDKKKGCIIGLKGEDLPDKKLGSRKRGTDVDDDGNKYTVSNKYANHAVTVAGFAKDKDGKCIGVYINDTGGWNTDEHGGSNRIFISKERFDKMQNHTRGFAVEYYQKR